jgi:FkbM family methyltransferase
MKVLLISAFPPDPAPEANHALHLSEHLAATGIEVEVLCKKGSIATAGASGITVRAEIEDWTWSDLPRLVRRLRVSHPDVVLLLYIGWVYGHQPMITFLPTICRYVLPGVPCVTQFENVDRIMPGRRLVARALRKVALYAGRAGFHPLLGTLVRDSARIIALSGPHKARLLRDDPCAAEKIAIVPPPPLIRICADDPPAARRRARKAIGAAADDFVIVYWGYIYPGKGIETLFEAFRRLSSRYPKIRLAIVGGALPVPTSTVAKHYYERVRELPETLGIAERVTWTGHFGWDSDAGSLYMYAGDVCVLPFDYGVTLNNSSLAAASTHGLPVIGTELPDGADEALLHGQNIYLCRPRDVEMLADAIELIIGTDELRERLRTGARRLARDWHQWDAATRRLIGILESAAAPRQPAGLPEPNAGDRPLSASGWSEVSPPRENRRAPLISIVVAAYNVGRYLAQCLDSLVNQTLKNIEIIVVDDASQDGSADIMQHYTTRYPELVRLVKCERNKGLATVRNIGMRVARGEYIGFLDGDDWADIRMCEVLYRRASDNASDVVIADAAVFYEDSKTFGHFFDQHWRRAMDVELRRLPFDLRREPRVMLLEPVAWTKLYRRSFLEKHGLQFEEGMNSYEDMCFHFSVLLKASRISLLDEPLFFYRQNRPGQISGRTDRKTFEVFTVFDRIHRNLRAWDASGNVWGLLVAVQLRQFNWLLRDRVRPGDRREFFRKAARQFRAIPNIAFEEFTRYARRGDIAKLFCMRRSWRRGYERVARRPDSWAALLDIVLKRGRLARIRRAASRTLFRGLKSRTRHFADRMLNSAHMRSRFAAIDARLARLEQSALPDREPLVEIRRVDGHELLLSRPPQSDVAEVFHRVEFDYYLLRTAIFREGDTVIDVGAHVGAISLSLAKKYPFIKIYALEPEPRNFECLQRNIELNRVSNVVALNKALSGTSTRATLYSTPWPGPFATIDVAFARSLPLLRLVPVETVTLEEVFREFDIRHCRVLKMTAPGAIRESLHALRRDQCIDLLCGEVDLSDCSKAHIEAASWRIARQHFWRTSVLQGDRIVSSWIHDTPAWRGAASVDHAGA